MENEPSFIFYHRRCFPVHNEGASIATTLREFHRVVMIEGHQSIRFVICEDGSTDDSVGTSSASGRDSVTADN